MAVFNGTDLILKLSSTSGGSEFKLLHATSCTISMASDTIDITDKDSSGFLTQLQGQRSHTLQIHFDSLYNLVIKLVELILLQPFSIMVWAFVL